MYDALRDFMADDFQKAEEKGIARGMRQGMEKGVSIGKLRQAKETATELAEMGMPVEKIARAVKVSVQQVREWLAEPLVMA